jgi:hypothetical protein
MITYNDCLECELHRFIFDGQGKVHICKLTGKQIYFETNKKKKDLIVKKCPKIKRRKGK